MKIPSKVRLEAVIAKMHDLAAGNGDINSLPPEKRLSIDEVASTLNSQLSTPTNSGVLSISKTVAFKVSVRQGEIEAPDYCDMFGEAMFLSALDEAIDDIVQIKVEKEGHNLVGPSSFANQISPCTIAKQIALIGAVLITAICWSASEVVDGVTWKYKVSNGCAIIEGDAEYHSAIPETTVGTITVPSSLGNYSVVCIGNSAFQSCSELTSIVMPSSIRNIGKQAFCSCSKLKSLEIPSGVENIGDMAFYGCVGLTSICIPSHLKSMGAHVFGCCRNIKAFSVADGNSCYCADDGVLFTRDKKTLVCYPTGKDGEYEIPPTVANIGYAAFAWCTNLTTMTIPMSVTNIGIQAFYWCVKLKTVTLQEGLKCIANGAFAACGALTQVTIPSTVESVAENAFAFCDNLSCVSVLSDSLKFGESPFYQCNSMRDFYVLFGQTGSVQQMLNKSYCDTSRITYHELCNVTFELGEHGAYRPGSDLCQLVESGESAKAPIFDVETEWGFKRWNADFSCVTSNMTINAQYINIGPIVREVTNVVEIVTIKTNWVESLDPKFGQTIAYVAVNGEVSDPVRTYEYSRQTYGALPEARRTGATFAGWYTAPEGGERVGAFSVIQPNVSTLYARWIEDDTTLYANWRANAYTVTFDSNGGIGTMPDESYFYDQIRALDANRFTRLGYTFTGWATSADGEVVFSDGASVSNLTAAAGFAVALFAQWEKVIDVTEEEIEDWVGYTLAPRFKRNDETKSQYRRRFEDVFGDNYTEAFFRETGKIGQDGTRLCVWHDYVAGTDPLETNSVFKAHIDVADGVMQVKWSPDLNEEGTKSLRNYKVWGKESLDEESPWQYPTNALHRFFKVTVEMP